MTTPTSRQKNEPRELDLLLTGANVVDVENDTILTWLIRKSNAFSRSELVDDLR
jgi:hypothetical protein